ncbi:hypothetical protein [Falsiroseomonas sp.]|uniref:hypothetical protein n=1 Tax=Falsiroseomonas sp. TaxID=2870721 RepID=UPI0034A11569
MRPRLPAIALSGLLLLGTAGALAQAEAERRLDAAIERLRDALGPEARIEIGGRRLDPVSGRATLTDIVIRRGEDRIAIPEAILSDLSDTRIGRAELRSISERSADGTAAQTGRVLISGLVLPPAGQTLSPTAIAFDSLGVEDFRGAGDGVKIVAARLALRDWRDLSLGAGVLEGFRYEAADGDALRLGRVTLDSVTLPFAGTDLSAGHFRAGRIALEAVAMRASGQLGEGAFDRLELRDWAPGRLTALTLEGLRGAGPVPDLGAAAFTLARAEMSGIDAAGTLEALLAGRQPPDPQPGQPQRLILDGFASEAEGRPLLALGRLLNEWALDGGIATATLRLDAFRLTLPRGEAAVLEALGYREIAGGIETRASLPRSGGRLEIDPLRIAWDQAATLSLAAQIDGVPPLSEAGEAVEQEATMLALAGSRLAGLTLTLRDQGLMGRVIAQQARDQRIPPARLREQWAQMALALPIPGGTQAADPFLAFREALAAFIRQPGTLEIALRPKAPVPLVELPLALADPAGTAQRLGLTATAR